MSLYGRVGGWVGVGGVREDYKMAKFRHKCSTNTMNSLGMSFYCQSILAGQEIEYI